MVLHLDGQLGVLWAYGCLVSVLCLPFVSMAKIYRCHKRSLNKDHESVPGLNVLWLFIPSHVRFRTSNRLDVLNRTWAGRKSRNSHQVARYISRVQSVAGSRPTQGWGAGDGYRICAWHCWCKWFNFNSSPRHWLAQGPRQTYIAECISDAAITSKWDS